MANTTNEGIDEQSGSRRIVIAAVVLALIVAGILWYVFVIREPVEVATQATPSNTADATSAIAFAPLSETVTATPAPRSGRVDEVAARDINVGAPTGPLEFSLAAALAAAFSGGYSVRAIRRQI